ncbi:MAG: alpha/beta hydrolase [Actinomycetales bacterium]|nr:MAG: alpha/beta hydrolase [Actinomycetales bacterium]
MNRLTALGVTAGAFVAAGVTAKVVDVRRTSARRDELADATAFGTVHSPAQTVVAHDGTSINVEVDEAPDAPADAPTIVFAHGWTCTLDTWHFQRLALRGRYRMVFYDQRSHGASGRSHADSSGLDDLAQDLAAVLDAHVPDGPVVLVGHSMGGMTLMELAGREPKLFGTRVVATMLIGTSSGRLIHEAPALAKLAPLLRVASPVLDWGRGFNSRTLMKRWAVGPGASDAAVDMTDLMIRQARTQVLLDFYPNFVTLDTTSGLVDLGRVPTVVLCGTKDMLTPFKHSRRLAETIPGSTLVAVEGAGHMVMLEQPGRVTEALQGLLERAA